jgi:hypothetical protein
VIKKGKEHPMKKAVVLLVVFSFGLSSLVYSEGMTRTVISKDTQSYGKGDFLLETGVKYIKTAAEEKKSDFYGFAGFGVTPQWDVSAYVPYSSYENSVDESDIGDIVLDSSYEIFSDAGNEVGCSLGAAVKLPTGKEEKHLGTGETDYKVYTAYSGRINEYLGVINVSYTITGDPSEGLVDYNDYFSAAAELMIPITLASNFSLGFLADFPGSIPDSSSNNYELLAGIDYYVNEASKFDLYAGKGFDDSSNDFRIGLNLRFLY